MPSPPSPWFEVTMTTLRDRLVGGRIRRTALSFLVASGLLALYYTLIGISPVRDALAGVGLQRLASLVIIGFVPVFLWGFGFHLVLDQLGHPLRLWRSILLFNASGFLNGITPFGQAGGDPVSAVLIGRVAKTEYETGLAAIGSLNALNRTASVFLGLLGVSYLGSQVAFGRMLRNAAVVVIGLSVGLFFGAAVGWRYRGRLVSGLATVLTPLARGFVRVVPSVSPPTRQAITRRLHRFVGAIERLGSNPVRLASVFGLGIAGQLAVAATLWVALAALGFVAPLSMILLIIPVAKISGAAPTPGGFGSAEVLLTTLLIATTGVSAAVAGAAALLYRASAFWLPMVTGGMAAAGFVSVDPGEPVTRASSRVQEREAVDTTATDRQPIQPIERLLIAAAVGLTVAVITTVHLQNVLIEPESIVVHVIRDAALTLLSFAAVWIGLGRLSR